MFLLGVASIPLACGGLSPGNGSGTDDDAAATGATAGLGSGGTAAGGKPGDQQASGGAGGEASGSGGQVGIGGSAGGAAGEGGTSAGGTPGTGPCYDEKCPGVCEGSCEAGFICNTEPVICSQAFKTWCGCDGQSFQSPTGCADRAYAHEGPCAQEPDEGKNCDDGDIVCLPLVPPDPCPEGQVHSIEEGCYGACVPIAHCACKNHEDCPDPKGIDQYTCHQNTERCGDWVR